jgi:hypothetical protein
VRKEGPAPEATPVMTAGKTLHKPAYGDPCNRCGICCIARPCALAGHVFPDLIWEEYITPLKPGQRSRPCPALERSDAGYRCGLATNPDRYVNWRLDDDEAAELAEAAGVIIGGGLGCDTRAAGETVKKKLPEQDANRLAAARAAWGWR